jgi:hypothetical protein
MHSEKTYFKELAPMIIGVARFEICKAGKQAGDQGRAEVAA